MNNKTPYLAVFILALFKSEMTWGQKVDCRLVKREITSLCNQLPQETHTTSCEDNSTEILLNKIDALSDQQEALLHQNAASNENSTEILLNRVDALQALLQSTASNANNFTKILIDAFSDQQETLLQRMASNENNSTKILLNRIEVLSDQQSTANIENNSTEILLNKIEALSDKQEALLQSTASTIGALSDQLSTMQQRLDMLHQLGSTPVHPASSCAEILEEYPDSSSGHYWVRNPLGQTHSVYCDMTRSCGGVTGGWMRVAYLDMTISNHQCPKYYSACSDYGVRSCVALHHTGIACSSVWYPSQGIIYSRVCGKVIGYDMGSTDGFIGRSYYSSINSNYVDGVSLTYGRTSRQHIWTFAARKVHSCGSRPAFVGNHYFCDGQHNGKGVYGAKTNHANPIWDGIGCGSHSYCHRNNPPWFYRHLPQTTTEDIEMRLCKDEDHYEEEIRIKAVEIYVQ